MTRERGLGRGLDALLGDTGSAGAEFGTLSSRQLHIEQLAPNPFQPRRKFDEAATQALADSIVENGIVQPILVRPDPSRPGRYQIVAGERRWRAAQKARLHEVPVVVRDLDDREALEFALIENIQREDLTPLEEAEGYQRLLDEFRITQEEVARRLAKSRGHVANRLRLLQLPEAVQALLDAGALEPGHVRPLVGVPGAEEIARAIVKRKLNVRQAETLAKRALRPPAPPHPRAANVQALEHELGQTLGLKVRITDKGERGELRIAYTTLEQLDGLLARLRGEPERGGGEPEPGGEAYGAVRDYMRGEEGG